VTIRVIRAAAAAAVCGSMFLLSGCGGAPARPSQAGEAPAAAAPGEELISVEAEGEANVIPGNRLNTRDQALSVAQRNAIEKAVGVLVSGQMVVSQARLIESQVFSKTAGYLKAWDILSEKEEDGLFTVKISAKVKLGDVRKDLDGLGLLIRTKKVGNPRVMVLVDETVDGQPSKSRTVETGLVKPLLDAGYKVVDLEQLAEIRSQDAVVRAARGDEKAAAELARRFGAEIALVGSVETHRLAGTDEVSLAGMISYRGRLNLKAVKTSSGQMVLADSREGSAMDLEAGTAATRCLTGLSEASGAELAQKLAPALWEGAEVQLAISGIKDFATLQSVVAALRAVDGVRDVTVRTFAGGAAELDCDLASGNAQTLAASLEGKRKPPMEIKEVAAYRIEAVLSAEGTQP